MKKSFSQSCIQFGEFFAPLNIESLKKLLNINIVNFLITFRVYQIAVLALALFIFNFLHVEYSKIVQEFRSSKLNWAQFHKLLNDSR